MSAHSAATRGTSRLALPRFGRPALKRLLIALAVVALLVSGWLWLRESSLVAVDRVTVTGVSSAQAGPVRSALESAAVDMTTLSVDAGALRDAVARFPLVRDVEVTPDFPHGLRIHVIERVPVGVIRAGGVNVVVAGDGTILRGLPAGDLPQIVARVVPGGAVVSDRRTRVKVAVLAAAPRRMRSRIVRVTMGPQGLIAVLASGPKLRFGDGSRLEAKWIAAARVLHDPAARSATYIDLRVPERPAAGGLTVEQGGTQVQASVSVTPPVADAATATATESPGTGSVPADTAAAQQSDPATATGQQPAAVESQPVG